MKLRHLALLGGIFTVIISLLLFLFIVTSDDEESGGGSRFDYSGMNLSAEVLKHQPTVEKYAKKYGVEDYVNYLTETITMQMANRMEKDPEVRYFPIEDNAPLSDYVTIGGTTKFEVDEEGNPVIYFPAGTVTDGANGEQSFRIPKLYQ